LFILEKGVNYEKAQKKDLQSGKDTFTGFA